MDEVQQLLNYLTSNPNATIRYHSIGMILFIHSDTSYLSVTKARRRASGVFFLSDPKPDALTFSEYTPIINGFICIMCKILRNIMASAAEAEYGALFLNGQAAVPIITTLIEMHHPPATHPDTSGKFHRSGNCQQEHQTKTLQGYDMSFHWIQDRILQEHFNVFGDQGPLI